MKRKKPKIDLNKYYNRKISTLSVSTRWVLSQLNLLSNLSVSLKKMVRFFSLVSLIIFMPTCLASVSGITPVAGAGLTPEYQRALAQAQAQTAEAVRRSGAIAIPKQINIPSQGTEPARVVSVPGGVTSVPGTQVTPEYQRALDQATLQAAEAARINGRTYIPVPLKAK